MQDVHARIQRFLQQQTIASLVGDAATFPDQQYMKAGVVPYVRQASEMHYLLMKPRTRDPLNPPSFQLGKGTRMYVHRGSGWRDMKKGDEAMEGKEPLIVTALREGIEELGLKLDSIGCIFDVGPYKFISERSRKNKYMWLFAVEMPSRDDVLPMGEVASSTAERGWLTEAQFAVVGREDHRYILGDIAAKLRAHYKE